jgi:phage host-nuclease inhibitor protein Gam
MADTETKQKRTPKALWEVSKLMLHLAQNVFASMRIEHAYKVKIAKLEKEKKEKLSVFETRHKEFVGKIHDLMQIRRKEVEKTGAKSVALVTGQVGWRIAAPRVEIVEGYDEKEVRERLLRQDKKYLRIKTELNRERILADFHANTLRKHRGIRVRHGLEEFFISLSPRGKEKAKVITIDE